MPGGRIDTQPEDSLGNFARELPGQLYLAKRGRSATTGLKLRAGYAVVREA
jgi:hypothetical protein